jgi:hypothetical protein
MKTSPAHELDDLVPAEDEDTRRALALLWLAESAPLTAAPPDALTTLRARLSHGPVPPVRRRVWRVLAVSGWAAAACLAVLQWHRPAGPGPEVTPGKSTTRQTPSPSPAPAVSPGSPASEAGTVQPFTDPADLRRQLTELRSALAATSRTTPGTYRPVIRELRPPGSAAPAVSQDRILDLIATALESDLSRRTHSSQNSREFVIESGWANWGTNLPADTTFRHRQFPAARWEELGLLKGAGGQFLDPATGWLWSPDPLGTDYTGHLAPAGLDRTQFAGSGGAAGKQQFTAPAGYLLTSAGGETIVALSNLPSVPAGASLFMTSYGADGNTVRYDVNSTAYSTMEGWSFSGLIPAGIGADFEHGFSLNLLNATGTRTVILTTGDNPPP